MTNRCQRLCRDFDYALRPAPCHGWWLVVSFEYRWRLSWDQEGELMLWLGTTGGHLKRSLIRQIVSYFVLRLRSSFGSWIAICREEMIGFPREGGRRPSVSEILIVAFFVLRSSFDVIGSACVWALWNTRTSLERNSLEYKVQTNRGCLGELWRSTS